jgi:amino acid adenylation domain-containing protein
MLKQFESIYHGREVSRSTPFSSFISYIYSEDHVRQSEIFWRSYFDGASPDIFPLPTSAENIARPDTTISAHFSLPKNSPSEFTTSTILRGAWAIVAAEYTGNEDVVYGAIVFGRNALLQDIDKIVGPTIATVPVRVEVKYEERISDFLHKLQQQSSDMIPFEQLGLQNIRRLSSNAELGCNFQTLLVIQSKQSQKEASGVLGVSKSADDMVDFNTYGLMIECQLHESGVTLNANFDSSLIDELQMRRILAQFGHVATQLCSGNPDRSMTAIEMVREEEKVELAAWEIIDVLPVQSTIHNMISTWARVTPSSQAIESWDGSMTHEELDTISTKLASHLVELGVRSGVFVPLCFGKSLWAIVAMLAVVKAGGAFVPLDASHPATRLEKIVHGTNAKLILCSEENVSVFGNTPAAMFVVNALRLSDGSHGALTKLPEVLPQDPSYCLFTSGTTGNPKGVVIEHAAICTSSQVQADRFRLSVNSRVLQFASYSFDISLFEILATLVAGGCVCVPSDEERRDPQAISAAITRMRVNAAGLTPSYIDVMSPSSIPTLTTLILGGEALKKTHVDTWAGSVKLMSAYGPTECTVTCSINNDLRVGMDPRNIGRGAGSSRWIVDPKNSDRLRPIGAVGELVIEGPLLARGYLNNPEKENEAFVQGPDFLGQGVKRRYKTGDLVRYNHDGTMTYVSRKDNQVKLRGQRIEVEEVEHHISSYDSMIGCVVLVPKSGPWEKQLVAMLAIADGSTTSSEQIDGSGIIEPTAVPAEVVRKQLDSLTDHLYSNLAPAMVPTMWIIVQTIPVTTSKKMDRVAVGKYICSMDQEAQKAARALIQSDFDSHDWSESELALRSIWSKVLHIPEDDTTINSNFFSLGGDSVLAMLVVSRCREKNIITSVRDMLRYRTISRLASVVQVSSEVMPVTQSNGVATCAIDSDQLSKLTPEILSSLGISKAAEIQDAFLCLPTQQEMLTCQLENKDFYRVQGTFKLKSSLGSIDIDRFQQAWTQLVARHDALRSRFTNQLSLNGELHQIVLKEPLFYFSSHHSENSESAFQELDRLVLATNTAQFSVAVCTTADGHTFCKLETNHAIIDHKSLGILLGEMQLAYSSGLPDSRTAPPSYASFVNYYKLQQSPTSTTYWQQYLDGCQSLPFPVLSDQPAQSLQSTQIHLEDIPHLKSFCEANHLTLFNLVQTAWALVLRHQTQHEEVGFCYLLSQRDAHIEGASDMVGLMLNVLPYRHVFEHHTTDIELALAIRDQFSDSLRHSYSSYERRPYHSVSASGSRSRSQFDTLINYRGRLSDAEMESEGPLSFQWVDGKDPMHVSSIAFASSTLSSSFLY